MIFSDVYVLLHNEWQFKHFSVAKNVCLKVMCACVCAVLGKNPSIRYFILHFLPLQTTFTIFQTWILHFSARKKKRSRVVHLCFRSLLFASLCDTIHTFRCGIYIFMAGMYAISVVVICLVNRESIFHAEAKSEPERKKKEKIMLKARWEWVISHTRITSAYTRQYVRSGVDCWVTMLWECFLHTNSTNNRIENRTERRTKKTRRNVNDWVFSYLTSFCYYSFFFVASFAIFVCIFFIPFIRWPCLLLSAHFSLSLSFSVARFCFSSISVYLVGLCPVHTLLCRLCFQYKNLKNIYINIPLSSSRCKLKTAR